MLIKVNLTLLLFLATLRYVTPFEFADAEQDGVEFGNETTSGIQTISVDEDNASGTYYVVQIEDAKGTVVITQVSSNFGKFNPVVEQNDTKTYIKTAKLDYEGLDDNQLVIQVHDDLNVQKFLMVAVKNLDDESPTLKTSNCQLVENSNVNVDNSKCAFTVSDPDGKLDEIDFSDITGDRGASTLFAFQYRETPDNETQSADVYLVLQGDQTLDYEAINLYNFNLVIKDSGGHSSPSIPVMVQVQDEPDVPPVWDSTFQSTHTLTEEKQFTIQVSAKDGDTGINDEITYATEGAEKFVSVDETGLITIKPIDRDSGSYKVEFSVIAIEVSDPTSNTTGKITLILEDIDDNIPEITIVGGTEKAIEITIDEGSSEIAIEIYANDIDMGENAIYNAELSSPSEDVLDAFRVIPNLGYEKTTLGLTIMKPAMLDFEDEAFRKIELQLKTTGTVNPNMTDSISITINLKDLNDEVPVFEKSEYSVEVIENVAIGSFLANIQATDQDAEDISSGVKHSLVGTLANKILKIEEFGGNITVIDNYAFDFERQTELIVQIIAEDNGGHQTSAQLTISVLDVNDEKPTLVVSSVLLVEENQIEGTKLTTSVSASDEDSTADLEFSIDWANSYATKNSIRLPNDTFATIQCIQVTTVPGDDNNQVEAQFSIKETQANNTPDYELFDTLFLKLVVTDKNTDPSAPSGTESNTALIIINIENINDNAPAFSDDTATKIREVTENAPSGTVIGAVYATDADLTDVLTYSIESTDGSANWVAIDADGTITVSLEGDNVIDCDMPNVIWSINYTVTATDGSFNTAIDISIAVLDQNDNAPQLENQVAAYPEDNELQSNTSQEGTPILNLAPIDNDRNKEFQTVECKFAASTGSDVTDRFRIENGTNIVVALSNGATLDREEKAEYTFIIDCYDDPTHLGPISNSIAPAPTVVIKLLDLNDKVPTISKESTVITGLTENTQKDSFSAILVGIDDDEGANGNINYVGITKISNSRGNDPPQDLFIVENASDGKNGILTLNPENVQTNLKGYYGSLVLTVNMADEGNVPLSREVDVTIEVGKFNFEAPKFDFPVDGETYYLSPNQAINSGLELLNNGTLPDLSANDQQDNKYAILFSVDDGGVGLFTVKNLDSSHGQLQISTTTIEHQQYNLTITANIDATNTSTDEAPHATTCTISIVFLDTSNTDPIFTVLEGSVEFEETKLDQDYEIPSASYPDSDIPDLSIYYLLREGNETLFGLDQNTGRITVLQELDYETANSYRLIIQSSNSPALKPDSAPNTQFTLNINVIDVNDNPPQFSAEEYSTILIIDGTDISNVEVTAVTATDVDTTSVGKLTYKLDSTEGSNSELHGITDPFAIDPNSGLITAKFSVSGTLEGYFILTVSATDEGDLKDTTQVKIFLVTVTHMVNFEFDNDRESVESRRDEIKEIFDEQFPEYDTIVESAATSTSDRSKLPVVFVDPASNVPVDASEILEKLGDNDFFKTLRSTFARLGLILMGFD